MRSILIAVGFGGAVIVGSAAAQDLAGDPEAGRKVAGMCQTCHGMDGIARTPVAANIGGEPEGYLARQLLAFKSGERVHEMMTLVAQSLSEQQIQDVAAWYESQTVAPVLPAAFDAETAPELCSGCHGADGIAVVQDAPNLAGENRIYLETQLKSFRSGQRQHEIMTPIAMEPSEGELRELSEWFASIGLEAIKP